MQMSAVILFFIKHKTQHTEQMKEYPKEGLFDLKFNFTQCIYVSNFTFINFCMYINRKNVLKR